MEFHNAPRESIEFHGTPWIDMHGIPWTGGRDRKHVFSCLRLLAARNGISWNSMDFHEVQWNSTEFHGNLCNAMEFHGIPKVSIEFHGRP